MTNPVIASVQALVENAKRLGLIWSLRPATVFFNDPIVTAIYDGDTSAIGMVSLIGFLAPGARVMAMAVPPAGNFIIGTIPSRGLEPERVTETTDTLGLTNTAFAPPTNGAAEITFVAPPSGFGVIHAHTLMAVNTTGNVSRQVFASPRLGDGEVFGAGTALTIYGSNSPADVLSMDIVTRGTLTESGPTRNTWATYLKGGLTPGAPYNIQLQFRITSAASANYDVMHQVVAWEPYV